MKLYEDHMAPNPRRVRIFMAEKGIEIPLEQVDIAKGAHRDPAFLAKSPLGLLPVLELDDGTCLGETVAICRYLEALHPEPPLMGTDPLDQARVEMWNRRMEFEIFWPIAFVFRNTHEFFRDVLPQVPEFGEVSREHALQRMAWLNAELAGRKHVAGDDFTIADITALCGIDFGRITGIRIAPELTHLKRWYDAVSSRPSAAA